MSYQHLSKPTQSGDAVECMVLVYYELLLHREKRWFDSDLTDKPRYRLKNWQRGDIDESLCGRKTRQKVRIFNFRLISSYTQIGGHWSKISGAIFSLLKAPNIGGPSLPSTIHRSRGDSVPSGQWQLLLYSQMLWGFLAGTGRCQHGWESLRHDVMIGVFNGNQQR